LDEARITQQYYIATKSSPADDRAKVQFFHLIEPRNIVEVGLLPPKLEISQPDDLERVETLSRPRLRLPSLLLAVIDHVSRKCSFGLDVILGFAAALYGTRKRTRPQ
jgi:hypothetical protein